jgi:hypothetical protein
MTWGERQHGTCRRPGRTPPRGAPLRKPPRPPQDALKSRFAGLDGEDSARVVLEAEMAWASTRVLKPLVISGAAATHSTHSPLVEPLPHTHTLAMSYGGKGLGLGFRV